MTTKRKLFIAAAAVLVILAASALFLWNNLDRVAKNAIEKYGSRAVGTAVRVDSVALELAKGTGAIRGLTVANPPGYSAPHIMSLGSIAVSVSPRSIAADPAVIYNIFISSPRLVYEMNENGVANVDALRKNMGPSRPARRTKSAPGREKRIRIRHLVIENAKADVRVAALGGKPRTVSLPRIEMKNIGGKHGAPPEDVAKQIASAILSAAGKEVGKAGAEKLLEKGLERILRRK